jgi:hypothetical protein
MYLGNIVSETPINVDGLFFKTDNINDIIVGIPTLVIGWDFTKRLFSNKYKLSILEKSISKDLFWTFTKKERRVDFEIDFKTFVGKTILTADKVIPYTFVNLMTTNMSEIKFLIQKLVSTDISHIYIKNNSFIYIFNENNVYGIDFNTIDFMNIDRKKVYRILFSNKNEVFFNTDFLSKDIKLNIPTNNNKIIPYLNYLNKQHGV